MMKKNLQKIALVFALVAITFSNAFAAEPSSDNPVMKGTPQVRIFTNFLNTNSNGASSNAFQITRAYFGYGYQFTDRWSSKITLDVGDPGNAAGLQMSAYLKQAYIQYQYSGLRLRAGMENTLSFDELESFWGHRYVMKSFQDEYNFNSSADIGITAQYKINSIFSVDASVMNGSGYKNVQQDSTFRYGVGLSITPVKGLKARVYFDDMNKGGAAQQSVSTFLGYATSRWSIGGEYNMQMNTTVNGPKSTGRPAVTPQKDHTIYGTSIYASYLTPAGDLFPAIELYARYDKLWSNTLDGATVAWNEGAKFDKSDNSTYIVGVQYSPVKGVKFSPNYRYKKLAQTDAGAANYIYMSVLIDIK